jgi:hypothetical protein
MPCASGSCGCSTSNKVTLPLLVVIVGLVGWNVWTDGSLTRAFEGEEAAGTPARTRLAADTRGFFDFANLQLPEEEIYTLLGPDAIPALTDPRTQTPAEAAEWLGEGARMAVVSRGGETLAVALGVLDWHEIVNATVGGEPIAITYCPLCDSVAVFSRRVAKAEIKGEAASGETERILDFGVSGKLYNSNVLMYDRTTKGLWSQLAMAAVSGPLVGTRLKPVAFEVVPFRVLAERDDTVRIVSRETGHRRDYGADNYVDYHTSNRLLVPVEQQGDALPRKTLGAGLAVAGEAWFVPVDSLSAPVKLKTPAGAVTVRRTAAGVAFEDVPAEAVAVQSYYFAWSAFFPRATIVGAEGGDAVAAGRGAADG